MRWGIGDNLFDQSISQDDLTATGSHRKEACPLPWRRPRNGKRRPGCPRRRRV